MVAGEMYPAGVFEVVRRSIKRTNLELESLDLNLLQMV